MMSNTTQRPTRLFGLIDAAVNPAVIYPLLEKSGVDFRSVFAGLPEDELGPAALFLAPIDDVEADWVVELDQIDLHAPCLTLVWSRVEPQTLISHLQAFLFAGIGDGMTAMVRYFDPRTTDAVFNVWGEQISHMFMGPIERWMYRGRNADWRRIENDSLKGARVCHSIQIEFEQADIDALCAHTEPDELLASLIDLGLVDGQQSYLDRLNGFMPRYRRAVEWGLAEAADRMSFCQHTYLYGLEFDRNQWVHQALTERKTSNEALRDTLEAMPQYVRAELNRQRRPPADAAHQTPA